MNSLRTAIDIFFRRYNIDVPLDAKNRPFVRQPFQNFDGRFEEYGRIFYPQYSRDEWSNIAKKIRCEYLETSEKSNDIATVSIFNLLFHFVNNFIEYKNGTMNTREAMIPLNRLLAWREISHKLGEDIFTCAHKALFDHRNKVNQDIFNWSPNLGVNKLDFSFIYDEKFHENHFHLKGSIPLFEVSWLSLMNNIDERVVQFDNLTKGFRQNELFVPSFGLKLPSLYNQVIAAASIRFLLFSRCNNIKLPVYYIKSKLANFKKKLRSGSIREDLVEIQNEISSYKFIDDDIVRFNYEGNEVVVDYAIRKKSFQGNQFVAFVGERRFLYQCFRKLLDGSLNGFEDLLYVYLLIKSKFREELIQVNEKVGFTNFSDYQDRKEYFIPQNTIYEDLAISMAVYDRTKIENIEKFELRVVPKITGAQQMDSIKKYDSQINYWDKVLSSSRIDHYPENSLDYKHFYVLHFIKERESIQENNWLGLTVVPRQKNLRETVKTQAEAIKETKLSLSNVARRIYGIDAASSELNARPEVFAQAFRYLSSLEFEKLPIDLNESDVPKLKMTYHAGEDFYDILDGIRTIDECIRFLGFNEGSRIGHGLALGIDPHDFYNFKSFKLFPTKQILFDNIIWSLKKIDEFGIYNEVKQFYNWGMELFFRLREEIFGNLVADKYGVSADTIDNYYKAWLLRGNNPECYLNYETVYCEEISDWQRFNFVSESEVENAHKDEIARFINHLYHYNSKVYLIGNEIKELKIRNTYVHAVTRIQESYINWFLGLGISIETNPTSNYLIGTFKRYAKHPIVTFNPPKETRKDHRIPVTINTDDQGVFNTSISTEYALLYAALKYEEDNEGNRLYDEKELVEWLKRIKKESGNLSFKKDK